MEIADILRGLFSGGDAVSPQTRRAIRDSVGPDQPEAPPPPPVTNQVNEAVPGATVQLPNGRWVTPAEAAALQAALLRRQSQQHQ
jgi:hypothetical protein